MRILYFDCIAGISGDMALGALVDAGADFDEIRERLGSLPVGPFEMAIEDVDSMGIHALRVVVRSAAAGVIRTYASIRQMLEQVDLPDQPRAVAQRIFRRLAEAEAIVHHKEVETVTFHEIGAVDSIVDITGTALALSMLGVERVFASPVPTGLGMTRTEHGAMPIPAPAVTELLRGAPLYSRGVPVELVTPTGAAILAALSEGYGELPLMKLDSVGYGAGAQPLDFPNVLRVLVGEEMAESEPTLETGPVLGEVLLETNIDDLNPELYEHVIERLFEAGAKDAWLTPVVMKKSRPAVVVSVLCSPERADAMRRILFRETGTLGVRASEVEKRALEREVLEVETSHGVVGVKIAFLDGLPVTISPEFADCARVARDADVPAKEVYEEAERLARARIEHDG